MPSLQMFPCAPGKSDVGLPDNRVTGIIQGPEGYLWVSTYDELCRFDGVRFQTVQLPELPGTAHHLIRAMVLGNDDSIWAALDGGVAMRIRDYGSSIELITNGLPSLAALSIAQEADGAIWISYTDGSVRRIEGSLVTRFADSEGLPGAVPCWLTSDTDGQIWFTKAGRFGGHLAGCQRRQSARRRTLTPPAGPRTGRIWNTSM